jgi:hypothetical protein
VEVEHIHRAVVVEHRLERRAAQQPEPPAVVRVVAIVVAVVAVAIEGGRVIDQADAVAARLELDEVDLGDAFGRQRVAPSGTGTPRYNGRKTSTGRSTWAMTPGAWPMTPPVPSQTCDCTTCSIVDSGDTGSPMAATARASASTTSPSPPVLAHGSHSAEMQTTRIQLLLCVGTPAPSALRSGHGSRSRAGGHRRATVWAVRSAAGNVRRCPFRRRI